MYETITRRAHALTAAIVLCAATCGGDDGGSSTDSSATADDGSSTGAPTGTAPSTSQSTSTSTSSSSGDPTTGSSESTGTTGESTTSTTTTDTDTGGGSTECPDPLPADYIFCEDFEAGNDPGDVFFEYNDGGGDFVVVDDQGASGTHSMQATYRTGQQGSGWVSVAFGQNPIVYGGNPHYFPNDDFDEVYWRVQLRMEPGWPDTGPHKVSRATAFAKANWGQAMIAHLWSAGSDVTLLGDPAHCVTGTQVNCNTYNDFANLEWLGQMNGTTPLFSDGLSGEWHCIEGHVALNTPGQSDGVFEFWIDGNLENSRSDIDWRESWTDYGINLVSFENYWNGGPPQDLMRWMDDIAIATVPLGCS